MAEKVNLFRAGMADIGTKVAMQVIRKIVRDSDMEDYQKLREIQTVVHSYEEDIEKKGEQ